MANHPQAIKRHRQSVKRRRRNIYFLSTMRTEVKKVRNAVADGNGSEAKKLLARALTVIDRVTQKGVVKKNNAARTKRRLVKLVSKLG